MRDLRGHRNGRLVAVKVVGRNAEGRALWFGGRISLVDEIGGAA